jgi:hypothetical protein
MILILLINKIKKLELILIDVILIIKKFKNMEVVKLIKVLIQIFNVHMLKELIKKKILFLDVGKIVRDHFLF